MTDRELLEAAARAAGINLSQRWTWGLSKGGATYWDPLEDDGQALRLAVKLGMNVYSGSRRMVAELPSDGDVPAIMEAWEIGTDHYAATRRAIVRAAAAMGGLK